MIKAFNALAMDSIQKGQCIPVNPKDFPLEDMANTSRSVHRPKKAKKLNSMN